MNRWVVELVDPQPTERLLDIGAGMGPAVVVAAPKVPEGGVIAVDPSLVMRSILTIRRLWQRARTRIEIHPGAAERLPIDDQSADAVWSVNSMHHWENHQTAFREIRRVLRTGGRLVLLDEDFDNPDHQLHEHMSHHHDEIPSVDIDEMAELLIGAGFENVIAEYQSVRDIPVKVIRAGP